MTTVRFFAGLDIGEEFDDVVEVGSMGCSMKGEPDFENDAFQMDSDSLAVF